MKKWILFCVGAGFRTLLFAQFTSGPMLSYNTMREVAVWVQTNKEVSVTASYHPESSSIHVKHSQTVQTHRDDHYTATLILDSLEPGITYMVNILVDGTSSLLKYPLRFTTQSLWQHRNDPPEFTFAAGSCVYINESAYDRPGTPYGSDFGIFGSIARDKPAFMLWLGDNTYLREADWSARSSIFSRYSHTRQAPELQELLSMTHHYAIWDDHDFGPNDANRSFANKHFSKEAFMKFWPAASYGMAELNGITHQFSWNDVDFFMLDDRWYRSPQYHDLTQREVLGKAQLQWLKDALKTSQEDKNKNFRVICVGSQFLSSAKAKENFSLYPAERDELIRFLQEENITNVVFLTGDRHHSELSILKGDALIPDITDLTVSALTSGSNTKAGSEANDLRVNGSLVIEHNYALITVKGTKSQRKMVLRLKNKDGKEVFSYELSAAK